MRFFAFLAAMLASLIALPASAQIFQTPQAEKAPKSTDKENLWLLDLSDGGRVTILLRPDVAPKMVERIKKLTREHFYDGTIFHRVMDQPIPIAQGGDPTGTGRGSSKYPNVPAEFNYLPHVRGAVSAARSGAPEDATPEQEEAANNSANSQFFIMFQPFLRFDHKYTVFGRVIDGMQWVDKIQRGEPPANPTRILHAYIAADNPPPYSAEAPVAATDVQGAAADASLSLPGSAPAGTGQTTTPPAKTKPAKK